MSSFLRARGVVGGAGLELSAPMVGVPAGAAEQPLERLPELGAENGVNHLEGRLKRNSLQEP